MQLNDIQCRFKDRMLGELDELSSDQSLLVRFQANQVSVEKRFDVYRTNILEKLTKVMAITYPTTEKLVGKDFFRYISYSYVRQYPPQTGDLLLYGHNFPDFIADLPQTQNLPYLRDVARHDWAFNKAYYAKDDNALKLKDLESLPPEKLSEVTFFLRDSVSLIQSQYPIDAIRDFCEAENDQNVPLNLDQGEVELMIFRPEYSVRTEYLDRAEYQLLMLLKNGNSLGTALDQIFTDIPDFDFKAFLQRHVSLGTFTDFQLNLKD